MRTWEPIKVVRHISRNACRIGTRSGGAVWEESLPCTKSHCLKPKLWAADPHTLIGADKEPYVWWLKAGSSNSGQHLAVLLSATGCHVFFTYWSNVNLLIFRESSLVVVLLTRKKELTDADLWALCIYNLLWKVTVCIVQLTTSCPCGESFSYSQKCVACTWQHSPRHCANHARYSFFTSCSLLDFINYGDMLENFGTPFFSFWYELISLC